MDTTQNSRNMDYVGDIKDAKSQGSGDDLRRTEGLVRDGATVALVDPWGNWCKVTLDLDYDKKVLNPIYQLDTRNPFLAETFIVYSSGPDGDQHTWDDNVISWDPEKSRSLEKPG